MNYLYMHEKLHAQHCKELQSEIERELLAQAAARKTPDMGRRAVGQLGKALVALGTWMERAEQVEQRHKIGRLITAELQYPK